MITRARKAREVRLIYTTSLPEILIECISSIRARKTREARITNNTSLLEILTKYTSSIENADCNLPTLDKLNDEFLIDNQLHRFQRTLF